MTDSIKLADQRIAELEAAAKAKAVGTTSTSTATVRLIADRSNAAACNGNAAHLQPVVRSRSAPYVVFIQKSSSSEDLKMMLESMQVADRRIKELEMAQAAAAKKAAPAAAAVAGDKVRRRVHPNPARARADVLMSDLAACMRAQCCTAPREERGRAHDGEHEDCGPPDQGASRGRGEGCGRRQARRRSTCPQLHRRTGRAPKPGQRDRVKYIATSDVLTPSPGPFRKIP